MRDEWSVRTERGSFSVRDGRLQVRTIPRSVLGGIHRQKWRYASAKRRGLFLVSILATVTGVRSLTNTALSGGPDNLLSYALLSCGLAFVALAFLNDVRSRNMAIPTRDVSAVERSTDDPALDVTYTEAGTVETTEIEFPSESHVEKAVEQLRYDGIRVAEKENESAIDETMTATRSQ
ncbi:hypothetical protein [Haladaptatus sp. NG-WS-4]